MRLLSLILVAAVFLSACGGGADATPTASKAATRPPDPSPTNAPTAQPTSTEPSPPTEPPAVPTDVPVATATALPEPTATTAPAATATSAPTATATPAPTAAGRISFRDNLAVADQLVLTMRTAAPPPDGSVYEGWLIADDGITEISTGVFEVGTDGSVDYVWTSPTGENLIARYASFAVTVEPADDSDPGPSSEVAFRGAADADTLAAARRVFAANAGEPATPRDVSYGQGLQTQSQVAKDHILNAFNAAAIGAYGEMRIHCEHVINIIEGTAGTRFSDYTGDGRPENPGDGFGALAYARQIAALLPEVNDDLSVVETQLIAIQDKAQEILAAPDIATAQPALDDFKALGEQMLNQTTPTFYAAAQAAVSYSVALTP